MLKKSSPALLRDRGADFRMSGRGRTALEVAYKKDDGPLVPGLGWQ